MEQALIDGIIVVHGGWRIVLVRLVQRHKEYVDAFLLQPLHALTNGGRLHKVQRRQELVAGIGAVQIQRAVKAQIHRLVDEVDLLEAIAQQLQEFTEQNRAVRQGIEVTKHLFVVPVLHSLTPDGDVKHLHHPLFRIRKRCKIKVVQTRKNIQQERNPAAGISHSKLCKRFGQDVLQRLRKVLDGIRSGTNAREGGKLVDRPWVKMVVIQEVFERQLQPAVLRKGGYASHQSSRIAIGRADILQNVFGRLLLQLDIAALGDGHKTVLDLPAHAAGGIRQQRRKLIFKIVFSICLTDEVQHGQAFLVLG